MQQFDIYGTLGALGLGALCAMALIWLWIRSNAVTAVAARTLMREVEGSISFLFDDDVLVDLTPRARVLMNTGDGQRSDWENLLSLLSARFPHLRADCHDLATVGRKKITPQDGTSGWIEAEYWNGLARITLMDTGDYPDDRLDPLVVMAMEHELEGLRAIGEDAPQLIWKQDADGMLVWANRAYIDLSEELHPAPPDAIRPWPPRPVFDDTVSPAGSAPVIGMHSIDIPNSDKPMWFEITTVKRGTQTIHFATDASAIVTAAEAKRSFVQTLTNTFAHLSVGLAIFDADRRLVMFNPAIGDLTGLPVDFLIGRPTLFAVLDRLRDQNMVPEPKNYTTWRAQMTALESAAMEGNYHEVWPLTNGQTFRVTGKPHPNGAIAFLMEDISDEVSLARKFRAQIETSHAVIDNLAVSIAVFSANGSMILANSAYRQLWGGSPDGSLANRDFADELHSWVASCAPSPVWIKLQTMLNGGQTKSGWTGSVWLDRHVQMTCHYAPLPGGHHQVTFIPTATDLDAALPLQPIELTPNRAAHG